jgi:CheY-like chemotaxis protein
MQKVLLANDLKPVLMEEDSFLKRGDITVFFASSNDEMLSLHIEKKMDLIVTKLDMPGHRSEEVFDIIRQSKQLSDVLTILLCEDTVTGLERCKRCGPSAIVALSEAPARLAEKVRQFLNVAPRRSYRVILNVIVEGKFRNRPFLCRMENISSSGILIKTDLELMTKDVISCSFYLPDGTSVAAIGEVARTVQFSGGTQEKLYGVKYTSIEPGAQAAIEAYVEKEMRLGQ